MTDPGTADRTYIGPMTPELVEQILDKASPLNVLLMFKAPRLGCLCLQWDLLSWWLSTRLFLN